ncbi:Chitin synthase, class 7 [Entomophthora muscae]|uniref:Chitin synthase, class 7 n=1 Tax=Entomophthora muscae TaxID=34485 RepID=A0ACC2T4T6_9FUNG|nr:Chitin synthase, class 7 [Entomophthora muscae]
MLQFGSYKELCQIAPLTVCPYIETNLGVDPLCYARSMTISGNNTVFEVASLIVYVLTLILCIFMIYSIKTKYTAIGRKEMVIFFYIYMLEVICEFVLISGIVPTSSIVYPYGAAIHIGLITACCWSLFLNGFVGFQFIEDGTPFSLWSIRLTTLGVFISSAFVAGATFLESAGLSKTWTSPLFIIHIVLNGTLLLVYYLMQLVLVSRNLDDRWPIGKSMRFDFAELFRKYHPWSLFLHYWTGDLITIFNRHLFKSRSLL